LITPLAIISIVSWLIEGLDTKKLRVILSLNVETAAVKTLPKITLDGTKMISSNSKYHKLQEYLIYQDLSQKSLVKYHRDDRDSIQ
jgi:hypothetical protein